MTCFITRAVYQEKQHVLDIYSRPVRDIIKAYTSVSFLVYVVSGFKETESEMIRTTCV